MDEEHYISSGEKAENNEDYIWLPRQDQLQEMMRNEGRWAGYYDLLSCFSRFVYDVVENRLADDTFAKGYSYEKLWIMFIMQEKYNKTWNGEDWIMVIN